MVPATAATQKIRRLAISKLKIGWGAVRWRRMNAIVVMMVTAPRTKASEPRLGIGAKVMAAINVATITMERIPPILSTGAVDC